MKNLDNVYRLRVGKIRVVFLNAIEPRSDYVILKIALRKDIYKKGQLDFFNNSIFF